MHSIDTVSYIRKLEEGTFDKYSSAVSHTGRIAEPQARSEVAGWGVGYRGTGVQLAVGGLVVSPTDGLWNHSRVGVSVLIQSTELSISHVGTQTLQEGKRREGK